MGIKDRETEIFRCRCTSHTCTNCIYVMIRNDGMCEVVIASAEGDKRVYLPDGALLDFLKQAEELALSMAVELEAEDLHKDA